MPWLGGLCMHKEDEEERREEEEKGADTTLNQFVFSPHWVNTD